jgi:hypothetical protein
MTDDQVWHVLHEWVPPEITHYVMDSHPGINWYLKTVVPLQSDPPVITYWQQIAHMHDNLVQIQPIAYDWQGDAIPACASVWIHMHNHVQLQVNPDHTWQYQIQNHIPDHNIEHTLQSFKFSDHTWHMIKHALTLKRQHVTHAQAHARRKGFNIIHGSQDSGPANPGSNLDFE